MTLPRSADGRRAAELIRLEESRAGQVRELAALKAATEQQQGAIADRLSAASRAATEACADMRKRWGQLTAGWTTWPVASLHAKRTEHPLRSFGLPRPHW